VNAGVYVLAPEIVKSVKPGTRVDLPTLLEGTIATGNRVNMFPLHEYWLDIGRPEDFERARAEFGTVFK
jgi:NDP-sugar pyrophosphorylase family protein